MKKQPREKRYRYVSNHVVERFRERLTARDTDHRLDPDLEQVIDEAVEHAIRKGDVEVIDDRGSTAQLVNLTKQLDMPLFALVKANDHPRAKINHFSEAIITVLDDLMVKEYRGGRWRSRDGKHRPFAALAGMRPEDFSMEKAEQNRDATSNGNGKSETVKVIPREPEPPPEELLVSYVGNLGVTYELVPRAKLRHHLVQLALDPDVEQETIRAWREVPLNVTVSVEVKL